MTFDRYNSLTGELQRGLTVEELGVQDGQIKDMLLQLALHDSLVLCLGFLSWLGGLVDYWTKDREAVEIITRRT